MVVGALKTMKLIVAVISMLCIAYSNAGGVLNSNSVFQDGFLYEYEYFAQILSSLNDGPQIAGYALRGTFIVEAQREFILFKIKRMQTAKINEVLFTADVEQIPYHFKDFTSEVNPLLEPFLAYYQRGLITKMETLRDDSVNVLNLKKAILTPFQLQLENDCSKFTPINPKKKFILGKTFGSITKEDDFCHYEVMEDGVMGESLSKYVVESLPWAGSPDSKVLNITKLRDFEDLQNDPSITISTHAPNNCTDCDGDEFDPVEASRIIRYFVNCSDEPFAIKRIESVATTLFMPLSAVADQMVANHSQVFKLIKVEPIVLETKVPEDRVVHEELVMNLTVYGVNETLLSILPIKQKPTIIDAYKLIDEVIDELKNSHNEDVVSTPLKALVAARVIGRLDKWQLIEVFQKYATLDAFSRRVIHDIFIIAGVPETFITILDVIDVDPNIEDSEAASILVALPFYVRQPFPELIKKLEEVVSRKPKDSEQYKLGYLAYATLVQKACGPIGTNVPTIDDQPLCTPEQEKEFVEVLVNKLGTDDVGELLLFIQALEITGSGEIVDALKPLIVDVKQEEVVRTGALYALMAVNDEDVQEDILEIASELLFNKEETAVMRIAAFYAFTASNPRPHHLKQLATMTFDDDEQDELIYMIYSYFDSAANATTPCHKEEASHALNALTFAAKQDVGIQNSQFKLNDFFKDDLKLSTRLTRAYVANNNSIFHPRQFFVELSRTVAGFSQIPLMIGGQLNGLESVIKRIFGPQSSVEEPDLESIFATDYSGDQVKDYHLLFKKLNITPRYDESLLFYSQVKYLSYRNLMLYYDAETVRKEIEDGASIATDRDIDSPVIFSLGSVVHLEPSSIGVPIFTQMQAPAVLDIKGKLKIDAPTFKDLILNPETTPKVVNIECSLWPIFSLNLLFTHGAVDPFKEKLVTVGAKFDVLVSLPHEFTINVNLDEGKLVTQVRPAAQSGPDPNVTLFRYLVQPFTTIFPYSIFDPIEKHIKPIIKDEPIVNEFQFGEELGVPLNFKSNTSLFWGDKGSFYKHIFVDNSLLSLLTLPMATIDIGYREYLLSMDGHTAASTQINTALNVDFLPSEIQKVFAVNMEDLKGIATYVLGWSLMPSQCLAPITTLPATLKSPGVRPSTFEDFRQNVGDRTVNKYGPRRHFGNPSSFRNFEQNVGDKTQNQYGRRGRWERQVASVIPLEIIKIPFTAENAENILKIEFEAHVTGPVTRKLISVVEISRNVVELKDTLNATITIENPPYSHKDLMMIIVDGEVEYPELPCSIPFSLDPRLVKPIKSRVTIDYGDEFPDKRIEIKSVFNKSEEQLESEIDKDSWIFEQCSEDMMDDRELSDACERVKVAVSNLNRMEHVISFQLEDLPDILINATDKLKNLAKFLWYYNLEENYINVSNKPDQVTLVTELSHEDPKLDIEVFKPFSQLFFENIYFPAYLPFLRPVNARFSDIRLLLDELTGGYIPPTCSVMKNSLRNFENVTYDVDLTTCNYVMTKDCSPSDLFSVTMTQSPGNNRMKELDFLVLQHTVLVRAKQSTPSAVRDFEVIINGETRTINLNSPILMLKQQDKEAKGKILAAIFVLGSDIIIKSPIFGLSIKFDGSDAEISVSNLYRGDLCGVCSEFDGDTSRTFIGPDKCEYVVPEDFLKSYFIPNRHCKPEPASPRRICPFDTPDRVGERKYLTGNPPIPSMPLRKTSPDYDRRPKAVRPGTWGIFPTRGQTTQPGETRQRETTPPRIKWN